MLENKSDQWPIFLNQPAWGVASGSDLRPAIGEDPSTEQNVAKKRKSRRKPAPPAETQSNSPLSPDFVSEAQIERRYDQYSGVPVVPFGEVKGQVSVQPLLTQPSRDADFLDYAQQQPQPARSKGSPRLLIVTGPLLGAIALSGVLVLVYKPGTGTVASSDQPPALHTDQRPVQISASGSAPRSKLIYDRFPSGASVEPDALASPQEERKALAAAAGSTPAPRDPPTPRETLIAVAVSKSGDPSSEHAMRLTPDAPRRVRTVVVRADGSILRPFDDTAAPDMPVAPAIVTEPEAAAAPEAAHPISQEPPPSQPAPLPEGENEVAVAARQATAIPPQQTAEPMPAESDSVAMPLPIRKPARAKRPARVERVRVVSRPQERPEEQVQPDEAEWRSDAFGQTN